MLAILKKIWGWFITFALPYGLKLLKKQAGKDTKLGRIATSYKESEDVYLKIKEFTKDDGILDANEIKELSPEIVEAFVAIFNVVDRKFQIRLINKNALKKKK